MHSPSSVPFGLKIARTANETTRRERQVPLKKAVQQNEKSKLDKFLPVAPINSYFCKKPELGKV